MSDETKKAETWAEFLDAVDAWWGFDSKAWRADRSPEAMRALADAACIYTDKRRARHAREGLLEPRCSFCGKTSPEVSQLVAGPAAYICDACVGLASDICGTADAAVAAEREAITASLEAGRIFRPPNRSADWAHGWEMACDWHAAAIRNVGVAAIRARGTTLTPQSGHAQNPGARTTVGESTGLASLCTRGPGDTGHSNLETVGAPPRVPTQAPTEAKASVPPFPCDNCTGKTSHLPWCYRVEVDALKAELEQTRAELELAKQQRDAKDDDIEEVKKQLFEARQRVEVQTQTIERQTREIRTWAHQVDAMKGPLLEALAKAGGA